MAGMSVRIVPKAGKASPRGFERSPSPSEGFFFLFVDIHRKFSKKFLHNLYIKFSCDNCIYAGNGV